MKIIVVRHGETFSNRLNRIQGDSFEGLTPVGKQDIENLGQVIASQKIIVDSIYSSDQIRALETAKILQDSLSMPDTSLTIDHRLREWRFGYFESKNILQTMRNIRKYYQSQEVIELEWLSNYIYEANKGVDVSCWDEIYQVTSDFFSELKSKEPANATIMIVSHGLTILTMRSLFFPAKNYFEQIPNGYIFEFEI